MDIIAPQAFYEQEQKTSETEFKKTQKKVVILARLRLLAVLCLAGFVVTGINTQASIYWYGAAICLAVFLALVRVHTGWKMKEKWWEMRLSIISNEIAALSGDITKFAEGTVYTDTQHPYSYDLDLFGKGSIYQLLHRCVTQNGSNLLASWLQILPVTKDEIIHRQQIVKELSQNPDFLLSFRTAGSTTDEQTGDYGKVAQWLDDEDHFINSMFAKVALFILPVASIVLIIISIIQEAWHPILTLVVMLNWVVTGVFSKHIKVANLNIGKTAGFISKYGLLQQQVANQQFKHSWLQQVAANSKASLIQSNKFRKLATAFEGRNNPMVGSVMTSFFLYDIFCLVRLENWRKKYKQLTKEAMQQMNTTDVFVTYATYAFNHPENNYISIVENAIAIEAQNLRHPLLHKHVVGNNVSLGKNEQFYLLTGANMTGKSTFIRTLGLNIVLGYLGLPIPAVSFSAPVLRIYTSIRVTDSVQDDISYFLAELNRIKTIMDAVKQSASPYLILIDEPLRGTNSADKQQGTIAIIETLLQFKTIGIAATHDIGLCAMATTHPGKINNYHFESSVIDGTLKFDYKLHSGPSTSNNATMLMQQMGIVAK